ncbi:Hypothetical protein, putative [Bodo saltans]|uniref:Uncharacterized protein n=1 Tax=Bodo saltans TaxID=75058 RepID=A0A0S4JDD5_BODSA|nr:Hypothetical protein, putative [Bodo saltans]|eukprot:CUG88178.1 Hypothetical protein, putative [Bodo saltans]
MRSFRQRMLCRAMPRGGVNTWSNTTSLVTSMCFFVRGRVVTHEDKFFTMIEDLNIEGIRDEMLKNITATPTDAAREAEGGAATVTSSSRLEPQCGVFRTHKRDGLIAASAVLGVLDLDTLQQSQLDAAYDVLKHAEVIMKEIAIIEGGTTILNEDWNEDFMLLHQRFARTGDKRILEEKQ